MKESLDGLLLALREGDLTATEFYKQSDPVWHRLARYLLRHWRGPCWFGEEEVAQELRAAAYVFVWEYQPDRAKGRSISRYVEWNAMDKAKKALHRARGASLSGNADSNPSNIQRPFSSFAVSPEILAKEELAESPEDILLREDAMQQAQFKFQTERERHVVRTLIEHGGDVESAVSQLQTDPQFTGPRDAARFAVKVVERLVG